MKRMIILTTLITLPVSALAGSTPPPPPPVGQFGARPTQRVMLAWMPGAVRCGEATETPVLMRRPYLALAWQTQTEPPKPVTYGFRIDAAGHPRSIDRVGTAFAPFGDDIAPSLAISTFRPGAERQNCSIQYTARQTPIAETPVEDLVAYTMTPQSGALPSEGWDRIRPKGATCQTDPRPAPLNQAFPDFDRVTATPGVRDWTMLRYDLDAKGRPVHVRVTQTTRNAALDAASVKAIAGSRYTQGPRQGCTYHYWRTPTRLEAPPSPDAASLAPRDAQCDGEGGWAKRPVLLYPQSYRRHSIEGWAIVAFDIAPWGETGNVRTLAAEPAMDFGRQAEMMIRAAKAVAGPTGKTGCVQKVRFVIGGPAMQPNEEPPEPPPPF